MDDPTEAPRKEQPGAAPRTRARVSGQARLALVGAVVSVVLAAGAFGGYLLAVGASASTGDAAADAPGAPEPTVTLTPTPTLEPVAPHSERPRDFASESGNLRCSMWTFSGIPSAVCQQVETNYARPAEACPSDAPGVFAGVTAEGPYWPCVKYWVAPQEVLPYDTPATYGDLTCTINYVTGVTCTNGEGHGFTMEYDAGIQHF